MKQRVQLHARKPRNPLHDHPLLRKGCVHGKSQKAERHAAKQRIKSGQWDQRKSSAGGVR